LTLTPKIVGKCTARIIATTLMVVCGLSSTAIAEKRPTYDKRIEEAAIRMLLPKLGEMRGPLDLNVEAHIFPPMSRRVVENNTANAPLLLLQRQRESSIKHY